MRALNAAMSDSVAMLAAPSLHMYFAYLVATRTHSPASKIWSDLMTRMASYFPSVASSSSSFLIFSIVSFLPPGKFRWCSRRSTVSDAFALMQLQISLTAY